MRIFILLISLLIISFSCNSSKRFEGEYYSKDAAITFDKVYFDDQVGEFGLHGSGNYIIKNNKIYLDNNILGKIVFDIISTDKIKGVSPHWVKDNIYIKQKK